MKQQAIRIIGSGNAAWSIGTAFTEAGLTVDGIYSRNKVTGKALASKLKSRVLNTEDFHSGSGICFLCVQDRNISEASMILKNTGYIPVHCSGSTSADVLAAASDKFGVFYPVASMGKNKPLNWKSLPVCIEASDRNTERAIKSIARTVTTRVHIITSVQRRQLHLAAVFANNFANACWSVADKITKDSDLPFSLLHPLITQAAEQIKTASPEKVQTGPAVRNDLSIIRLQEKLLKNYPEELKIYKAFTKYLRAEKNS